MLNINAPEFVVILVVALVVIGPQRLPEYAESLGRWVRQLRDMALDARDAMRVELGPEFDEVDWAKYDPRQYDPRRIVRDALLEPREPKEPVGATAATAVDDEAFQEPEALDIPADPVEPPPVEEAGVEAGATAVTRAAEPEEHLPTPFDAEAT